MFDPSILCAAWNLPPIRSSRLAETGTIHQTYLLDISDGSRYALRAYRHTAEKYERIVQEHVLCIFVRDHGLPVLAPVPLLTGETILEYEERFYALFPFAEGSQVPRGQLDAREIAAMGHFLGELHHVLHAYPHAPLERQPWVLDRAEIFARLDVTVRAIRAREQLDGDDQRALSRLIQMRTWLLETQPIDLTAFAHLERQIIHGDYQETNLFFVDGKVSAIIDWDQAYAAPRAWEVMRTLHYAGKLAADFCQTFLASYRQAHPLPQEELDCTAAVYGWMHDHNLWVPEELYLRGNERVRALLEPGDSFIPFAERWAALSL